MPLYLYFIGAERQRSVPARLARPPHSAWLEGGPERERWRAGLTGELSASLHSLLFCNG